MGQTKGKVYEVRISQKQLLLQQELKWLSPAPARVTKSERTG